MSLKKKRSSMSDDTSMVSVVGVYELASDMGKEMERLVQLYGTEAVDNLVPKVIDALELLEQLAVQREDEDSQVDDLRSKVAQLETDKVGKAEDRLKYERELEQLEENLRDENRDLIALVGRLQSENRKLNRTLTERNASQLSPDSECGHEQDIILLQKMDTVLAKQREQMRIKERELQLKVGDLEAAQYQLERLTAINKELHRKQRSSQLLSRALIEEKGELQAQLQDQQRELQSLRVNLCSTRKTNEDLVKMKQSPTMPNLTGKVMYDVDDPDRPRFTMNELRKILFERNELKARVSELLDELELLRPKTNLSPQQSSCSDGDDAPVEGPINRDPDDAPWNRVNESGIRKLFRVLFGDSADSKQRSSPTSPSKVSGHNKYTSIPHRGRIFSRASPH